MWKDTVKENMNRFPQFLDYVANDQIMSLCDESYFLAKGIGIAA